MRKSAYSDVLVPEGIERENLIKKAYQTNRVVMYEKQGTNYRVHCTWCGADGLVPYKKLKMIRDAGICWKCGREFKNTTTKTKGHVLEYCSYDNINGFIVQLDYNWGDISNVQIDHFYHYEKPNEEYVRLVSKFMYAQCYRPEKEQWRRTRTYYNFYHAWGEYMGYKDTLRSNYEDFELVYGPFKSNQKKFISLGVYNKNQLLAIKCFDLNYPDDLVRNSKYIKQHDFLGMYRQGIKLNSHYLDYLTKTGIKLHDYIDYVKGCIEAGEKPEKPKKEYFWKLHDNRIIQSKYRNNKQYDNDCYERFRELESNVYGKNEYLVMPFQNALEIIKVGEHLHNCIGTYIKRYANKETDIYYATKNGDVVMAIEVFNGKVNQCRADHNGTPAEQDSKFVLDWCKEKKIEWKNTSR